jgi:D-alanyl-D-alanine carboxypeptidase/D-alanyl-D-alanine-endopeptidase (penicillin-binding protein 4)
MLAASGADRVDRSRWLELAATESFPLRELVAQMMKSSQNLYAQLLLLQVGARNNNSGSTTEAEGLIELRKFLREIGVDPEEVQLDEGSGLSRRSLVTPNATVGLLKAMSRHPHAAAFLGSLPIAGVDGTLSNRLIGTKAEKNVRAKTGTLDFVHCLSGYVTTAAGERLAFAVMLNGYEPRASAPPAKEDVDAVPRILAEFAGRTENRVDRKEERGGRRGQPETVTRESK